MATRKKVRLSHFDFSQCFEGIRDRCVCGWHLYLPWNSGNSRQYIMLTRSYHRKKSSYWMTLTGMLPFSWLRRRRKRLSLQMTGTFVWGRAYLITEQVKEIFLNIYMWHVYCPSRLFIFRIYFPTFEFF